MKYTYLEKNNFNLHLIQTKKFKTIEINVKYKTILSEQNVTFRSILPYVLKSATNRYSSKITISKKLEEMYGARLYASTSKMGQASVITFSLRIVDGKYLQDQNLLIEALAFIKEMLFKPFLVDGFFSQQILEEEKRLLKDEFIALKENKSHHAMRLMINEMMPNELYRLSSLGIESELDNLDVKQLYDYYLKMLCEDEVDIVIAGNIKKDDFLDFSWEKGTHHNYLIIDPIDKKVENITTKEVREYINQSHLTIGFRTHSRINRDSHFSLVIFNAMLGGFSHSRLFQNVREKASLAYSVSSSHDGLKGVIFINSGIDFRHKEEALNIILQQVEDMKNGDFTDSELLITKNAIINDLYESMDSLGSIAQKVYYDRLIGRNFSLVRLIASINKVSKQDIIKAGKKIQLDTILFLIGENNEENK